MAKIYVGIKAKEFLSHKKIELEIVTENDGQVMYIQPVSKDRKKLLATEETVILPKRIWDKIPSAEKFWNAEHNMEPEKEPEKKKHGGS